MAEVADCCGCCCLCLAMFSCCGRMCLFLPCFKRRDKEGDQEDEEYAAAVEREARNGAMNGLGTYGQSQPQPHQMGMYGNGVKKSKLPPTGTANQIQPKGHYANGHAEAMPNRPSEGNLDSNQSHAGGYSPNRYPPSQPASSPPDYNPS